MADDALDALLQRIKRLEAGRERTRTMIVDSVQEGGRVNLREADDVTDLEGDDTGGIIPGVPSLVSAAVAAGDVVIVREARGQHVVIGSTGDHVVASHSHPSLAKADHTHTAPVSATTVSDSAAPAGQRWKEISSVWEREGTAGSTELWLQRVTAGSGGTYTPPAVTTGTVTKSTSATAHWRPGVGWQDGASPTQGKYRGSGYGNHTGLWMFASGTWSAIPATATITGCRVSVARIDSAHGHTYGGVPVHLHTHNHQNVPGGSPSLALGGFSPGTLALGQRETFDLPASVGAYLRDNPGGGIACQGPENDYLIFKSSITVEVDWED